MEKKKSPKKWLTKPKEKPVKLNMSFDEAIGLAVKAPIKKNRGYSFLVMRSSIFITGRTAFE